MTLDPLAGGELWLLCGLRMYLLPAPILLGAVRSSVMIFTNALLILLLRKNKFVIINRLSVFACRPGLLCGLPSMRQELLRR